jgi:hypothetical protein
MSELEYLLVVMLVLAYGAACYTAGKGDLMSLIPKMLQEKAKEIEEKRKEDSECE